MEYELPCVPRKNCMWRVSPGDNPVIRNDVPYRTDYNTKKESKLADKKGVESSAEKSILRHQLLSEQRQSPSHLPSKVTSFTTMPDSRLPNDWGLSLLKNFVFSLFKTMMKADFGWMLSFISAITWRLHHQRKPGGSWLKKKRNKEISSWPKVTRCVDHWATHGHLWTSGSGLHWRWKLAQKFKLKSLIFIWPTSSWW